MIIITEEEKKEALILHSQGWNKRQITQKILRKRGDDIYYDIYRAVTRTVADVEEVEI